MTGEEILNLNEALDDESELIIPDELVKLNEQVELELTYSDQIIYGDLFRFYNFEK